MLTASGYLEIGDEDKALNPWYYDVEEFKKIGTEQDRYEFALAQQQQEIVRLFSYLQEAERYAQLADALQSAYFRVMANCVWQQCELSRERMDVWTATVDSYQPF